MKQGGQRRNKNSERKEASVKVRAFRASQWALIPAVKAQSPHFSLLQRAFKFSGNAWGPRANAGPRRKCPRQTIPRNQLQQ
ncbi:hypothetical protein PHJA_002785700 [Phtheirospermum japonicum]|uniref:Uncharacterized protein n=1 Tax=Phtheirospermum japonicum TaxID=374723 RepID=A0A830D436_9LAMI|nr:hypothetical protein PHJA_002785700 [Phtheirospermum japonicum]